ncbi:YybH family protein [Luteimonas suaedae]|uniref:YybH family protein n=1 Tax=Luteimonas suaedae TaxID=2605430 RepID=UPI0011EBF297|nr:SgcJ/EcaC family oxidoreductase [Luteimonas suaedae]
MSRARCRRALLLLLGACLLLATAAAQEQGATAPLRETLDRHLQAIQARDLEALMATVTDGEALTLILPNGKVLTTREEFRQLHVDWFAEDDWRMRFQVRQVRAFGDTGIALVHYLSQQRQHDGSYATRREALLSLVFAREQGEWRLVYDQNTVVPPAPTQQ